MAGPIRNKDAIHKSEAHETRQANIKRIKNLSQNIKINMLKVDVQMLNI